MPLWSRKWPFLGYTIESAPLDAGVYGLWQEGELIYIGASDGTTSSLRSRLLEHFAELGKAGTPSPDHYSWELSDNPHARQQEVLRQFVDKYGQMPKFNPNTGS
jgi:hypothetical protein